VTPAHAVALGAGWRWLPIGDGQPADLAALARELTTGAGLRGPNAEAGLRDPNAEAGLSADLTEPVLAYLGWFAQVAGSCDWEEAQVFVGAADGVPVVACFAWHEVAVPDLPPGLSPGEVLGLILADDPDHVTPPEVMACEIDGTAAARARVLTAIGAGDPQPIWEIVTYLVPGPERAVVMYGMSELVAYGDQLGELYDDIAATLSRAATRSATTGTPP
jgi:hypothetical protein